MTTVTASEAGAPALKPARFLARTSRKRKPETCASCVFDEHCTGVFGLYADRYGMGELRPVSHEAFESLESRARLAAVRLRPWLRQAVGRAAPWVTEAAIDELNLREVVVTLRGHGGRELRLLLSDRRSYAVALSDWCAMHPQVVTVEPSEALEATRATWSRLERSGMQTTVPPGPDAFEPLEPSVAARLRRLRDAAPFGELTWAETRTPGPARVEILLRAPDGVTATVWLTHEQGRASGGYRVDCPAPPEPLVEGLRQVIRAVKGAYQLP